MQEQTGSMRLEPRVGARTEVGKTGRAKTMKLPSPDDSGQPPKTRPGLPLSFTHLCLCLATVQGMAGTGHLRQPLPRARALLTMQRWVCGGAGMGSGGRAERPPPG